MKNTDDVLPENVTEFCSDSIQKSMNRDRSYELSCPAFAVVNRFIKFTI